MKGESRRTSLFSVMLSLSRALGAITCAPGTSGCPAGKVAADSLAQIWHHVKRKYPSTGLFEGVQGADEQEDLLDKQDSAELPEESPGNNEAEGVVLESNDDDKTQESVANIAEKLLPLETLEKKIVIAEKLLPLETLEKKIVELFQQFDFHRSPMEEKGLQLISVDTANSTTADAKLKHLKNAENIVSVLKANLMENMGTFGKNPGDASKTLQAILDLLTGITDNYRTEHGATVKSLNDLKEAFETCKKMAFDAFLDGAAVAEQESTTNSAESTHRTCRSEEETARVDRNTKCQQAHGAWVAPPQCNLQQPSATPTANDQTNLVQCMQDWKTWYDTHFATQNGCKTDAAAYEQKRNTCNGNQKTFEQEFCQLVGANETTCNAQTDCFRYLEALRLQRIGEVQTEVDARKDGFTRAKRIECLVNALASFGNHQNHSQTGQTDVPTCMNQQVDATEFDVTVFAKPSKVTCDLADKPCDQTWLDHWYSSSKIPSLSTTPVAVCEQCQTSSNVNKCIPPAADADPQGYNTHLCQPVQGHSTISTVACFVSCAAGYGGTAIDTCSQDGGQFVFNGCAICSSFTTAECPLQCSNHDGNCQQCSGSAGCQNGRKCVSGSCVEENGGSQQPPATTTTSTTVAPTPATTTTSTTVAPTPASWHFHGWGWCTSGGVDIKTMFKSPFVGSGPTEGRENDCKNVCVSKTHCIGFSFAPQNSACHIFGDSYEELSAESPELLSDGWLPYGTGCVTAGSNCVVDGVNPANKMWGKCTAKPAR